MTPHEYAEAVASAGGVACVHGHASCALERGGACVDEVLTNHEANSPDCEECDL